MIAYLDLPSGISGDMFLGCLVDAGWPVVALRATIEKMALPPAGWSVQADTVMRGALRATLVRVEAKEGDQHRHLSDVRQIIESQYPSELEAKDIADPRLYYVCQTVLGQLGQLMKLPLAN